MSKIDTFAAQLLTRKNVDLFEKSLIYELLKFRLNPSLPVSKCRQSITQRSHFNRERTVSVRYYQRFLDLAYTVQLQDYKSRTTELF